ncbi:ADP-ribosylation/Crystallin J1 [Scenedesmus sp. NREL 46B-D3]|nr:ADP-ribosylation/Crystallin J1 [Scenedesmus sp. NREL 46B-D3]
MSWSFDVAPNPLPPGHVTGDFITMLAVAWSLVRQQQADAFDMLDCLASSYSPGSPARYSPYNALALEGLSEGTNPFLLAKHAEQYLAVTPSRASQSCSHRPDRQLHGTEDFAGVIRAVPVGIAYRDAPQDVLREAADAATVFTHPTELGGEGAVVVAAAVAWLSKADPASATPQQLLEHLQSVASSSPDMTAKLQLLQQQLPRMADLGCVTDWRAFWGSAHWAHFTATANLLWKQNLAMQGTQAAALALWVVLSSWRHPKQAVMLAASLGGYAATTGGLVGGLAGALHGCSWVPQAWWGVLQEEWLQPQQPQLQGDAEHPPEEEEALSQGELGGPNGSAGAAAQQAVLAGQQAEVVGWEEAAEGDALSVLRVGKHAVVALGKGLAAVSAQQVPQLLG